MRRRLTALLGASLLLSGCAAEQPVLTQDDGTSTSAATSSTAPATADATADAAKLPVGEWAPADCPVDQPCDVEFRVTDLVVTDHCEFGRKPGADPLAPGTWVLTLYSEARSGLTADGRAHLFPAPVAVNASGETHPTSYDQPCADNPAHSGFEYLLTGIEENSATRFADVLAVPADARELLFEGHRIALPAPGETTDRAAGSARPGAAAGTSGSDAPGVTGPAEPAEPYLIGECESDGHALFSDGVRRPVASCPNPMPSPPASLQQFSEPGNGAHSAPPHTCPGTGRQVTDPGECGAAPGLKKEPAPSSATSTAQEPPAPESPAPEPSAQEPEGPNPGSLATGDTPQLLHRDGAGTGEAPARGPLREPVREPLREPVRESVEETPAFGSGGERREQP